MFSDKQIEQLNMDLDARNVKQRNQAGMKLSYIEAWWAISEANRIFGAGNWTRETLENVCVHEEQTQTQAKVSYRAKVRITISNGNQFIFRDGTGYGHGVSKSMGQSHESAGKEAESDAMKRALMTFGNPFGLALYDKDQKNVSNNPELKAKSKAKSRELFEELQAEILEIDRVETLKQWSESRKRDIETLPDDWADDLRLVYGEHLQILKAGLFEQMAKTEFGDVKIEHADDH